MNKLIGLIAILLSLSVSLAAFPGLKPFRPFRPIYSCESCGCWEKCFRRSWNPSLADEYTQLYRYVQQIREGKILNGARSTALLADLTQPNFQSFQLQKNLIKLAAFGLNAGRYCHPTTLVSRVPWGSFSWFPTIVNGACPTACQLSQIIDNLPYFGPFGIDSLASSCTLANFIMSVNPFQCPFSLNRYAVAFANSYQNVVNPWCSSLFTLRAAVEISTPSTGFSSSPQLIDPISYSSSLLQASQSVVNCIRKTCCSKFHWWKRPANVSVKGTRPNLHNELSNVTHKSVESIGDLPEGTTFYVDATDPTRVKQTKENLKQFLKNKEKADPCAVASSANPICDEKLCQEPGYVKACPLNCQGCNQNSAEQK